MKEGALEKLRDELTTDKYIVRALERSLLKAFTNGNGFEAIDQLIASTKDKLQQEILHKIKAKFIEIDNMKFDINEGQHLYFFQKYCIYEAKKILEKYDGVVIANEPGTGKTVITLAMINGNKAIVLTPNPVVSSWLEQEEKFITNSNMEALRGPNLEKLKQLAKEGRKLQVVANIEFTRDQRAVIALSDKYGWLVIDESDYLNSLSSQQTKGTRDIISAKKILLSATPFSKPSDIIKILDFVSGSEGDVSARSKFFGSVMSVTDQEDINALSSLMNDITVRVRKEDVFDEYDKSLPLTQQSNKLPHKEKIDPYTGTGEYELTIEQSESVKELFTDYQTWCQKHKGKESNEDKSYFKYNEGYFSKKEALRQIMNDPKYVGINMESPKHKKMEEIVIKEMNDNKKVLIFCRYKAQVEEYVKRYSQYGALAYYGDMKQNAQGYKTDDHGNVEYYKVDSYGNYELDANKQFIKADKNTGVQMKALDYSRILFQNNPNNRVIVATYDAGAVGVTLTAADAVIYDDLAQRYRDEYQAGDRAHRIDNDRPKYDVRYYWLKAKYPQEFLNKLSEEDKRYFINGTYDDVQYNNILQQGRIFHRIADGIGDDSELNKINGIIKDKMPFLFEKGDPADNIEE